MVSINIDLSDDFNARVEAAAKSTGLSLEDFVRNCIAARLHEQPADSLLNDTTVYEGTTPADLSSEHDKYLAIEADAAHIEYMRRGLEEAKEAIARGDVVPWDKDVFLAEMHQKHGGS